MYAAVALLAAANFALGLGTSSLYVDEGLSWHTASAPLGDMTERLKLHEISPPGYYALLHEWIGRVVASDAEWKLRLPSAAAGVLLALATAWLGSLVAGRRAALGAGALVALSPLVLEYAQQARAYVFAALAATVAAAAALEGLQRGDRRWLAGSAAAAAAAVWLHYTAGLVVLVVIALVAARMGRRAAALYAGAVALVTAPLVPLLADQLASGTQAGYAEGAKLTLRNVVAVLGAPFYGRDDAVTWAVVTGALALAAAVKLWAPRRGSDASFVVAAALVAPVAALLVTIVGDDVLLTRYAVVCAPFALVAIAAAPRPVVAVAIVAALFGSVVARTDEGRYPDVRAAFADIRWQPTDALAVQGYAGLPDALAFYVQRDLPPGAQVVQLPRLPPQAFAQARAERRRLWLLTDPSPRLGELLRPLGYEVGATRRYEGRRDLQLSLALPR